MSANNGASPVDDAVALRLVLASKWSLKILHALADGPRRRMDIWSAIERSEISHPSGPGDGGQHADPLDRALDRLVSTGLVARAEKSGVFPRRVVYSIAPGAEELVDLLVPLSTMVERFVASRRTSGGGTSRRSA